MPEKHFDGRLFSTDSDCVLGIDPSLTGFAMTAVSVDSDHYTTWVYTSPMRGVDRLLDISKWMSQRIWHLSRTRSIRDVAIEGGVVRSPSSFVLGELAGVVKAGLNQLPVHAGRYPLIVPPMSLKKFVAGRGTGVQKSQILLKVYKHWGVEFTDDNAADSFGLAHICRFVESGEVPSLGYQKEVLDKLQGKFRDTDYGDVS